MKLSSESRLAKALEEVLKSAHDSLNLVRIFVEAEMVIEEDFGCTVNLANEQAASQVARVYASIKLLCRLHRISFGSLSSFFNRTGSTANANIYPSVIGMYRKGQEKRGMLCSGMITSCSSTRRHKLVDCCASPQVSIPKLGC